MTDVKKPHPITAREIVQWPRANPAELARFDPRTKVCTMNCGPSLADPRGAAERKLLCDDCDPAGRSYGNTGTCGLTDEQIEELNAMPIRNQVCDVCHSAPATRWFGLTASVLCDSPQCLATQQDRWDEAQKDDCWAPYAPES